MRYLMAAAFAAFLMPAQAAEPPQEGMIIQGMIPICDTERQMRQVWDTHKAGGMEMADYVMKQLHERMNDEGNPVCGMGQGAFVITKSLDTAWLDFKRKMWSALVEVVALDGRKFYSIIVNAREQYPQEA